MVFTLPPETCVKEDICETPCRPARRELQKRLQHVLEPAGLFRYRGNEPAGSVFPSELAYQYVRGTLYYAEGVFYLVGHARRKLAESGKPVGPPYLLFHLLYAFEIAPYLAHHAVEGIGKAPHLVR